MASYKYRDPIIGVTTADWDVSTVRTYMADYDAGDDANDGYTAAVKTLTRLAVVLPRYGNGRKVRVLVKMRAAGAAYRDPTNANDDDLDVRQWGYVSRLFRGCADFTDTAAERITCGYVTAQAGPGLLDQWAVGSATSSSITIAAGTLSAVPALNGKRIRMLTGALAGKCAFIVTYDAGTGVIQIPTTGLGGTPAAATTFMIEEPATQCRNILSSGYGFPVDGYSIVGFKANHTSAIVLGLTQPGTLTCTFLEAPNAGFTFSGNGVGVLNANASFTDPDGTAVTVGGGCRHAGAVSTAVTQWCGGSFHFYQAYTNSSGSLSISLMGSGSTVFAASYSKQTVAFANGTAPSAELLTIGTNAGQTSTMDGKGITLSRGCMRINGVVSTGLGSTAALAISGSSGSVLIDAFTGSTGNTGVGIDVSAARNVRLVMGITTDNTVTGTAGDIKVSGSAIVTHAQLKSTVNLVDDRGNDLIGQLGRIVSDCQRFTNKSGGALSIGMLLRSNGTTAQVTTGQADTSGHADGTQWVALNAAASDAEVYAVCSGSPPVLFTGASPTIGARAFLSDTAGKAATTAGTKTLGLGYITAVNGTDNTLSRVALSSDGLSA